MKPQFSRQTAIAVVLAAFLVLLWPPAQAQRFSDWGPPVNVGMPDRAQSVVSASTTEDLYAAVNNPANEGVIIDLAPGTYVLTPGDSSGSPRPNLGSLILQPGMVLRGHNQYADLDGDGVWDPPDPNPGGQ